jgi:hypothetical protein
MAKRTTYYLGGFRPTLRHPGVVALVVAAFGVAAMLLVDHGPWSRPKVQSAKVANYQTTGEAARAAGARVMPTLPKPAVEPKPPGPKTSAAINPVTPPL